MTTAALAAILRLASPPCAAVVERLHVGGVGAGELARRAATCIEVDVAARRRGLEPGLAVAVAWHESHLDAGARSARGARGPLQVLPRWHCPGRRAAACDLVGAALDALVDYTERYGLSGGLAAYVCGPVRRRGRRCRAYAAQVERTARQLAAQRGEERW